jgi:hypothetical protein
MSQAGEGVHAVVVLCASNAHQGAKVSGFTTELAYDRSPIYYQPIPQDKWYSRGYRYP